MAAGRAWGVAIMRPIRWACPFVLAIACSPAPEAATPRPLERDAGAAPPVTVSRDAGPPKEEDTARRIARIEHGLIPEVRVKGEPAGRTIEEQLRKHHTPGVSIAIIHDHRVVAAKAYGVADSTAGTPLTDTTVMQAASVSKMFTALAALKEVEAGKLGLDADVNRTLRSWKIPENDFTRATPVTLKHLLSHTGGTNVPTLSQDGKSPTLLEVLEGKPPSLNRPVRVDAAPGKFRYSGGGTTIVQQMLVDVEGRPFPEIMSAVVLTPLKLTHSTFSDPQKLGTVATGHDFDEKPVAGTFQTWAGSGAAGLWTTPSDIAQLLVEVQLGLEGRSTVVSKEVASRMTTPVLSIGKGDSTSTALGVFVEKHGTGVYFGHDGLGIGFLAMSRASTNGEGAVVMANGQGAAPLMLEIFRSVAAEYAWDGWLMPPIEVAHVDPSRLTALAGRYRGEKTESTVIVVKGDHLEARLPFREPLELLAVSPDTFISRAEGVRFTFATDASGVRSIVRTPPPWPPAGTAVTLTRLPDNTPLEPLQLLEAGRADEATLASKKLLSANPKDPTLDEGQIRTIGEDLLEQLDAKRALPVLQLNVALHPQSPMACVNVAEALFQLGRRAEAAPLYTKAKTLFATDTVMSESARSHFLWKVARLKALETPAK